MTFLYFPFPSLFVSILSYLLTKLVLLSQFPPVWILVIVCLWEHLTCFSDQIWSDKSFTFLFLVRIFIGGVMYFYQKAKKTIDDESLNLFFHWVLNGDILSFLPHVSAAIRETLPCFINYLVVLSVVSWRRGRIKAWLCFWSLESKLCFVVFFLPLRGLVCIYYKWGRFLAWPQNNDQNQDI